MTPLPATPARIEAALRSLRGAPMLTGGRGGEGVDLAALAHVGSRLGELLLEGGFELLELNPVVAPPRARWRWTRWRGGRRGGDPARGAK